MNFLPIEKTTSEPIRATGSPPRDRAAVAEDRGVDKEFSRRKFLALAGGIGAVGALGVTLGPKAWDSLFVEGAGGTLGSSTGRTLVLLTLYGRNDGMNTVVPYQDPGYPDYRGPIALPESSVLPLGEGFGLHPALSGFKSLWDAHQLAVVHGVGFANPNYSHFESMDIWQSGVPGTPGSSGWLGRWLDGTNASPLRAVGIGPTSPTLLTGDKVQGAAIPTGGFALPGSPAEQALFASLARTSSSDIGLLAEAALSNADLLTVQRTLGPILDRTRASDPLHLQNPRSKGSAGADEAALAIANGGGGLSSSNVLATQLSMVANLILAGTQTDAYSVELGGFDTHSAQLDTQTKLLGEIDAAVPAFLDAIAGHPRGSQTVVVIYTEFGRRAWANASDGTDHGWANVVFAAGQPVRGGFYGEPPSLSKLSEGNLVYTTDFRSVYSTVFDQILGVDPRSFLGGSFPPIAFL